MRIDCRYCHGGVETGRHAGIPPSRTCMNCHSVAAVDRPGVAQLRSLYQQGLPVPWKRIHRLPDFVYFSHQIHIGAGIGCENCHGDVAKMDVVQQVRALSMGNCIGCHRDVRSQVVGARPDLVGPENCTACHR
jgi:mono/diheme cytochrome c family protein